MVSALRMLIGMALLLAGTAALAWVVVTELWTARGFDWAMWAAVHLGEDPVTFGNRVINMTGTIGTCGLVASLAGVAFLWTKPAGSAYDDAVQAQVGGGHRVLKAFR